VSVRDCENGCESSSNDAWCNCDPPDCGNGHCLGHIGKIIQFYFKIDVFCAGLCQCKPGYFGDACDKLVAAVVVPIVMGASSLALAALICYIIIALFREKGEFEKDIKEEPSASTHSFHTGSTVPLPTDGFESSLARGQSEDDLFSKARPSPHYSELTQSRDSTEGGVEDYSSLASTYVTDTALSPLHSSTEDGRTRPPPALSSSADLFKATVAGRPLFIPAQPRSHSRRHSDSDSHDSDSIELDPYTPH